MTRYYWGVTVFIFLTAPFTTSFGWCNAKLDNQNVLTESKIKKSSFKKIVREIKNTLPKELRKCPVVVTKIKLLREKDEFNVDEEWMVDVCQTKKFYFVSTSDWPKGYWVDSVELKEERVSREKRMLSIAKKLGTTEEWRDDFFYIDDKTGENK